MPDPRGAFRRTLIAAGIEPVPIYALQKTFAELAFEAGLPLKVVAQCTRTNRYGRYQKLDRTETHAVRHHLVHYEQYLKQVLQVTRLV